MTCAEVRVTRQLHKGRDAVDLRICWLPEGADEFVPGRMGVTFDRSQVPAVIDVLTKVRGRHWLTPRKGRPMTRNVLRQCGMAHARVGSRRMRRSVGDVVGQDCSLSQSSLRSSLW
jgi:hypothetical protein